MISWGLLPSLAASFPLAKISYGFVSGKIVAKYAVFQWILLRFPGFPPHPWGVVCAAWRRSLQCRIPGRIVAMRLNLQ